MGGFAEYKYIIPKAEVVKVPDELIEEEVMEWAVHFGQQLLHMRE